MADMAENDEKQVSMNSNIEDEVDQEKWAKDYSSNHQILLVGEGDFSFSLSLANSFGSAYNIVATSLDSYDVVIKKYKKAKSNLELLGNFGAQLLHGVDAIKMKLHTHLQKRKFDRIVYNFPHAGFVGDERLHTVIRMHRNLVRGFLENARGMLRPSGEVHVTHKTTRPFCNWNLKQLGAESCLALLECVRFEIKDYPGYNVKRGDGRNPDDPFPLGSCATFKFIKSSKGRARGETPLQRGGGNPAPVTNSSECFLIFREYFNHARLTFGQADDHLIYSVPDMLQTGFERYMTENYGKRLNHYINLLEELWYLSKKRIAFLQNQLLEIEQQRGV